TTDLHGRYSFAVEPGTYRIRFDVPERLSTAPQDQGSDDTVDSDVDTAGLTEALAVEGTHDITHVDAGFQTRTVVGGRLYADQDGDGELGSTEPMLPGVRIALRAWPDETVVLGEAISNANGFWLVE